MAGKKAESSSEIVLLDGGKPDQQIMIGSSRIVAAQYPAVTWWEEMNR